MAPAADDLLNGSQAILPRGDAPVFASAMFEEQKASLRLQDPPDVGQSPGGIAHAAESPGAHDHIEPAIAEGKLFGWCFTTFNWEGCRGDTLRDAFGKKGDRVHSCEAGDASRIVRKVKAGAEPDFEYVAARLAQQGGPELLKFRTAHEPVHEPRKDYLCIQSHCSRPDLRPGRATVILCALCTRFHRMSDETILSSRS